MDMLNGIALVETCSPATGGDRIHHFPATALAPTVVARFEQLFARQQTWTSDVIQPYLE